MTSYPISIRQFSNVSLQVIHETAIEAFMDYPVPFSLSLPQFEYMLARRGYDPDVSFGAFDGETLVGFITNGIRNWGGKPTAYDIGTGLVKAYRRKGIAARMFEESLPILRGKGVQQYLLEVIQTNTAAYDLYRKKGFSIRRSFDCYVTGKGDIVISKDGMAAVGHIRVVKQPDWDLFRSFWDFEPSWQNSVDSLDRQMDHLTTLSVAEGDKGIVGYGIIENHTGDIPQLCIGKPHRRKGYATALLKHLIDVAQGNEIRLINALSDNKPLRSFAESVHMARSVSQYEMIKTL
jgi:ribosomal protein S18 acetylase RimI-like enzyme